MKLVRDLFLYSKQVNAGDLRCCVSCVSAAGGECSALAEMTLLKVQLFLS